MGNFQATNSRTTEFEVLYVHTYVIVNDRQYVRPKRSIVKQDSDCVIIGSSTAKKDSNSKNFLRFSNTNNRFLKHIFKQRCSATAGSNLVFTTKQEIPLNCGITMKRLTNPYIYYKCHHFEASEFENIKSYLNSKNNKKCPICCKQISDEIATDNSNYRYISVYKEILNHPVIKGRLYQMKKPFSWGASRNLFKKRF